MIIIPRAMCTVTEAATRLQHKRGPPPPARFSQPPSRGARIILLIIIAPVVDAPRPLSCWFDHYYYCYYYYYYGLGLKISVPPMSSP